jgi:hypothetical protein
MRWGLMVAIALGLMPGAVRAQDEDNRPVEFQRQVGGWMVIGDASIGLCMAVQSGDAGHTSLAIASYPSSSSLLFSLTNPAWKSLKADSKLSLTATFTNAAKKITDLWQLSAVVETSEMGVPSIKFDIERAKNDGANFIDQFKRSTSIWFWKDRVPVADFSLAGSANMIEVLLECRTRLQLNENFDPFAG